MPSQPTDRLAYASAGAVPPQFRDRAPVRSGTQPTQYHIDDGSDQVAPHMPFIRQPERGASVLLRNAGNNAIVVASPCERNRARNGDAVMTSSRRFPRSVWLALWLLVWACLLVWALKVFS